MISEYWVIFMIDAQYLQPCGTLRKVVLLGFHLFLFKHLLHYEKHTDTPIHLYTYICVCNKHIPVFKHRRKVTIFWEFPLLVTIFRFCSNNLYIYICVCVCVYIYIYIYICECVCVYIYIYMCVCVYIYIYIYIYIFRENRKTK